MGKIDLLKIKKLREKTKAGIMDCRQALEECKGDFQEAVKWLRKKGINSAEKRCGREVKAGIVESYTHSDGRIAAVVEVNCETDFVARTEEFKNLAHELVLQVAAMNPKDVEDLLKQPYIRDEKVTVEDLIKETSGKLGENILVRRIFRCQLGE